MILDDFIEFKHPAMGTLKKKFYLGVLFPRNKQDIKVDYLKKTKNILLTDHALIFDDFSVMRENQFLNNDVFVEQSLNQDFRCVSKILLEKIINKNVPKIDGIKLFNELVECLKDYVYFRREIEYKIVIAYIIGTYMYDNFAYYPILHFFAERGSGKTISAKFISQLGWNSYYTINITKAGLSRVNSQRKGVVIIDEKENINDSDDLKLILNGCFQKGSREVLTEKTQQGNFKLIYFDLYTPVVIASINPIFGATSDRMIRIEMMRNKVKKNLFENLDSIFWANKKDELFILSLSNWGKVKKIYDSWSGDEITNRDLDIWKPLLSIMSVFASKDIDSLKEYIQEVYIPYKRDVQEGSTSSLLCDFVIDTLTDNEEYLSTNLFIDFKKYVEIDAPFLSKKMTKTMFGLMMSRIGYTDKYKIHKREGNYYIIVKQLAIRYNEQYFHKKPVKELTDKIIMENIGDDDDEL